MAKKDSASVLWWIGWIALTIASFFVAAWFWTGIIARHYGSMQSPGAPAVWTAVVFGSWMLFLVPLIIVMYYKVDKAYEDARIARENAAFERRRAGLAPRSAYLEESKRLLPAAAAKKLKHEPPTVRKGYETKGHLITAILRDGRQIENVFVLDAREIVGVYDRTVVDFSAQDIVDIVPSDGVHFPRFEVQKWLRLDEPGQTS